MNGSKISLLGTIAAVSFALTGCGGGGGPEAETGQLTLGLTDAPLRSATGVYVAFTGFELKRAGDAAPLDPVVFDSSSCDDFDAALGTCTIDLLGLTGETRKVVFSDQIPAGNYDWIRLMVDADQNEMDSYITLEDGTMCSIWVPSGDETGLKIVSGITVTANGVSDYTLDFDVMSSISVPPGLQFGTLETCNQNYILKPAIRIVDTTETGTIAGTVAEAVLAEAIRPDDSAICTLDATTGAYENVAVYVFENFDNAAVADDIDAEMDNENPITTAAVEYDATDMIYSYEVGFLLASEGSNQYKLALTCTADVEMPDTDEFDPAGDLTQDFVFIAEREATTEIGLTVDGSF